MATETPEPNNPIDLQARLLALNFLNDGNAIHSMYYQQFKEQWPNEIESFPEQSGDVHFIMSAGNPDGRPKAIVDDTTFEALKADNYLTEWRAGPHAPWRQWRISHQGQAYLASFGNVED